MKQFRPNQATVPRDSVLGRARRRAALLAVRGGERQLKGFQIGDRSPELKVLLEDAPDWTIARLLALHLTLFGLLAVVLVAAANNIERVSPAALVVIFALMTSFLIRRGSGLRRLGLELAGRSVTSWAAATGSLAIIALTAVLEVATFIPDLLSLSAAWLVLLAVWKRLPSVMLIATFLVGPLVWASLVWERSVIGGALVLLVALAFARSGVRNGPLFVSIAVHGVITLVAWAHQLVHSAGHTELDGSDLLSAVALTGVLVAAGQSESWHADWTYYSATLRKTGMVTGLGLAALASQPSWTRAIVDSTTTGPLARVGVGTVIVYVAVWVAVSNRPVRPGGKLIIGLWTALTVLTLAGLTESVSLGLLRYVGALGLGLWGAKLIRDGLASSRSLLVIGGFAFLALAVIPNSFALIAGLLLIVVIGAVLVRTGQPVEGPLVVTP